MVRFFLHLVHYSMWTLVLSVSSRVFRDFRNIQIESDPIWAYFFLHQLVVSVIRLQLSHQPHMSLFASTNFLFIVDVQEDTRGIKFADERWIFYSLYEGGLLFQGSRRGSTLHNRVSIDASFSSKLTLLALTLFTLVTRLTLAVNRLVALQLWRFSFRCLNIKLWEGLPILELSIQDLSELVLLFSLFLLTIHSYFCSLLGVWLLGSCQISTHSSRINGFY